MAIVEDSSTPAVVTRSTSGAALSTASFSPPAGSLVVALCDFCNNSTTVTASVSDSGSHSWTNPIRQNGASQGTAEIWWTYLASAPGSITVTGTPVNGGTTEHMAVRVYTGAASTQTGATAGGTPNSPQQAITTTTAGSLVVGAIMSITSNQAALTALASTTSISWFNNALDGESSAALKASSTTGTPGSTTFGYSGGLTQTYEIALWEILPATSTFVAPPPRRSLEAVRRAATW